MSPLTCIQNNMSLWFMLSVIWLTNLLVIQASTITQLHINPNYRSSRRRVFWIWTLVGMATFYACLLLIALAMDAIEQLYVV